MTFSLYAEDKHTFMINFNLAFVVDVRLIIVMGKGTVGRVNLPLQCMESIRREVSGFVLRLHLPARVIFLLCVFLSGDAEDPVRSVSSTCGGGDSTEGVL